MKETLLRLVSSIRYAVGSSVCLCIAATKPDGTVFTGYYNADATDKAVFAHNIQSDVTMDIIRENIGKIKEMLEENDDG